MTSFDCRASKAERLPPLRDVIRDYGLQADKRLGQHFLFDPTILKRIAALTPDITSSTVVEIGPGPGGLTRALLNADASQLIVVERDHRCVAALQDLKAHAGERLEIVEADALQWQALQCHDNVSIVANLPYNIATPLLMGWLNQLERIRSMVLMFQKEVGDRIVAEPGSKAYGRLAVITQWLCEVRRAFDLPPGAFIPPPKVSSSVIVFIPRSPIPAIDERKRMSQLTAAAFGQRRKMLRASLKSFTDDPEILLRNAGIDPTLRAENLFLEDFLRILASERQL